MKRIVSIVLMLAMAVACAPQEPTERVFSPYDETPITDCTGDTDILKAEAVVNRMPGVNGFNLLIEPKIKIKFSVSRPVAFTSTVFENGKIRGLGYWDAGTIERFENGEWVKYCALQVTANDTLLFFDGNKSAPYAQLTPTSSNIMTVNLPVTELGKYRLTYTFRDSLSYDESEYTTSEEVYSISHTITLLDATDNKYDIAYVFFGESTINCTVDGKRAGFLAMHVDPLVRVNDGSQFYYDRASYRLEALVDGEWVEAPLPDRMTVYLGNDPVEVPTPAEIDSAVLTKCILDDPINRFALSDAGYRAVDLCISDPSLDYRLCFDLTTERDPDSERVHMQVRLRFDE